MAITQHTKLVNANSAHVKIKPNKIKRKNEIWNKKNKEMKNVCLFCSSRQARHQYCLPCHATKSPASPEERITKLLINIQLSLLNFYIFSICFEISSFFSSSISKIC